MSKKVKITLLTLMVGASIAGIATTIVSCSASSSNELQIEKSPTLEKDITNSLTQILNNEKDYLAKKDAYDNIINNDHLPESTLSLLKNGMTFKNDGNVIPWENAISKLKIEGPQFTQVAKGDIHAISIELEINNNYVVLGSSLNNLKFSTGTLGNVGTIPILSIGENIERNVFLKNISDELTNILENKKTYQEMRQTYEGWISDPKANLPSSIWTAFDYNFTFNIAGGTKLFFRNIVDNLLFEPLNSYPNGVNQKIPNFAVTIDLIGDGYEFINPEEEAKLKIGNIEINADTKKIDANISPNLNNINIDFKNYLNPEIIPNQNVYQDVKTKFNNILDPTKLPKEIKESIVNNIGLKLDGYEDKISFDQIFKSIEISIVNQDEFPKTPNSQLPNLQILFEFDESIYETSNSSLYGPINIDLSNVTTGSIKYQLEIKSNLNTEFQKILSNEIKKANTWQEMKTIYDSWSSFDNLPNDVKQLVKQGITFNAVDLQEGDVNISGLNDFDTVVDNISLNKDLLPEYGHEIGSIDLELNMNNDSLYFDDSNNYQNKIYIKSGSIGNTDKPIEIIVETIADNIKNINFEIQKLISEEEYIDNKNIYDSWNNIGDFGEEVEKLIKESIDIRVGSYPKKVTFDEIIDPNNPPIIVKEEFPNEPNININNFYIKVQLNKKFCLNNIDNSFLINLGSFQSKGDLEIVPKVKNNPSQSIKDYFTNYLNNFLIEGFRSSVEEQNRFSHMIRKYESILNSNVIKDRLVDQISYINVHTDKEIDISGDKFSQYFINITSEIGRIPANSKIPFPPVTIKIRLSDKSNFTWSNKDLILEIKTDNLKSAADHNSFY
ncbi:MAG: hypothetical protein ACRCUM_02690 [Mycoplasmoidaceae bacterium]